MAHKLAPAESNSPVDASHLIILMEHPNRAAARRCTGFAGALRSGWTEFYLQKRRRAPKKDSSDSFVGFERLTNYTSTAKDARDAKEKQ
ncbi:MAG TPA: hypothetical protein VGR01_18380 [Burkholderiales bacterium]|jgi:hypothetical protein|nr:hypothetical protein [Burkholderiales bacterium]